MAQALQVLLPCFSCYKELSFQISMTYRLKRYFYCITVFPENKVPQFCTPVLQLYCSTSCFPNFGVNLRTYVVFATKT